MILALLFSAALAQAALDDPLETACYAADFSQQGMNRCAGEAYERADKALNAEWAKIMAAKGEKEEEKLLLDAQRAWIKYRDAHCTYDGYEARGGSMEPMLYNGCRARLTRERIAQLRPEPL